MALPRAVENGSSSSLSFLLIVLRSFNDVFCSEIASYFLHAVCPGYEYTVKLSIFLQLLSKTNENVPVSSMFEEIVFLQFFMNQNIEAFPIYR